MHIVVAITGGIATYKICEVVRRLLQSGHHVQVVMTDHATQFVTPLTFEALTGQRVLRTEWTYNPDGPMPHIDLNRQCDLLLVAPATANILAKAAHGIADDLVSTLIAARRTPIAFVPAMNEKMWLNPATQRNVQTLQADGCLFIGPACGSQACGDQGAGRMVEPADIVDCVEGLLTAPTLAGRRILITTGPTTELIDPVRCITNRSSGRQGLALARAARNRGADVTVIAGPLSVPVPYGVKVQHVLTAVEMDEAVQNALSQTHYDLFIGVAAVADWRAQNVCTHKIKKQDQGASGFESIQWVQNPDILQRASIHPSQTPTIGFAAETETGQALIDLARQKCIKKGARFIIANNAQLALESDQNHCIMVGLNQTIDLGLCAKETAAERIMDVLSEILPAHACTQ